MATPADNAVAAFSQSYSCSQSVFSAFATRLGLDRKTALKLASPFGGGLARRGEICGAVTGALLVLGLGRGADEPSGKEGIYHLSQEFMRRFEQKHGSLLCRDLLGCDVSTAEGWEKVKAMGKSKTVCQGVVRDAAEIAQALLELE